MTRARARPWQARGRVDRPLPLLGAPWAEALLAFKPAQLRAACVKQGLAPPPRASRLALAQLLTHEKYRVQAEQSYRDGEVPFPSHAEDYTMVCDQVVRHGLRHVIDLGCGPGLLTQELLRDGVLPAAGSYLGVDNVAGAIALARTRFAGDRRARFQLRDLTGELPRAPRIDGVLLSFVISYLDTHSADRLVRRLARAWPGATLVVATSIRSSLNGRDDYPPDPQIRRYLAGERRALAGWDTRRLRSYMRSLDDHFGIVEEHHGADPSRIVWVARRAPARGAQVR